MSAAEARWMALGVGCLECSGTVTVLGVYPDEATALAAHKPVGGHGWYPRDAEWAVGPGALGVYSDSSDYQIHILPVQTDTKEESCT